jgi:outer membrane protein W
MIFDLIDMYTGFGVGLFFASCTYETDKGIMFNKGYIKTTPALAFVAQLGVDYPISDKLSINVDITTEQMSFKTKTRKEPTSTQIVESIKNSTTQLSWRAEAPIKIPGSNVAVRAGIRYAIF